MASPVSFPSEINCLAEIICYLENPGSVARVSKAWEQAARIVWLKKFEQFHLTEPQIKELNISKELLYAVCSKGDFAVRRCIDEQGMEIAQKMVAQVRQINLPHSKAVKDAAEYFDLIETESMNSFLLENISLTCGEGEGSGNPIPLSRTMMHYPEIIEARHAMGRNARKTTLIKTFREIIQQLHGQERSQYINAWISDKVTSQPNLPLFLEGPQSKEAGKTNCTLFMPPIPVLAKIQPTYLRIVNDFFPGMSDKITSLDSIKGITFISCNTVHFPAFEKMKKLTTLIFRECHFLDKLPSGLEACPLLEIIEINSCNGITTSTAKKFLQDWSKESIPGTTPLPQDEFIAQHLEDIFTHPESFRSVINKRVKVFMFTGN